MPSTAIKLNNPIASSSTAPSKPARKRAKAAPRRVVAAKPTKTIANAQSPKARRSSPQAPKTPAADVALGLAETWHEVRGAVALAYGEACSKARERGDGDGSASGSPAMSRRLLDHFARLERAETELLRETPKSAAAIAEYIEIAEEILAERHTDPNGALGRGPALEILTLVRKAVLDLEGIARRPDPAAD